ncbi:MAG: peptide chain release factor 1 [Clostridia bacterium]|nr:peptide chain release factor 1 [Clostridia bacterium]
MLDRLAALEDRFKFLDEKISDPEVIADQETWRKYCKEHSDLSPIVQKYDELKKAQHTVDDDKEMLSEGGLDKDFEEMVKDEISQTQKLIESLNEELKILLLPKDPNDDKNVIIEIRGGTGGEEAALFAADLLRMYSMYAEQKHWKIDIMNSNATDIGGYKEVSFSVEGQGAYSRFKFESGVHRVQRVPETESQGRVHTSAVTVAVLPEVEEVEVEINQNDLRIDVFRAGGPGGQCVNTTDSAVRITHLPTGIVVSCQDEKSQFKNKDKAMKILRSRIYEQMEAERHKEIADARKSQIGSGDRSERIRTYNFPQSRVTDHRINLTLYKLEQILNGSLDEIIDALITADQAAKLSGESE